MFQYYSALDQLKRNLQARIDAIKKATVTPVPTPQPKGK